MPHDPNGLTERQKECLRFVARGWEMKDIALELGISPDTVKNHLAAARRALGVWRSIDAARLLELAEPPSGSPIFPSHSRVVPDARSSGLHHLSQSVADTPRTFNLHDSARERPNEFEPWTVPLPFPTRRGQRNELGIAARLAVTTGLIVLLIAAVGFFVEASKGLKL